MLSRSIIRARTTLLVSLRCAKIREAETVKLQSTATLILPGIRTFAMGSFWSSNSPSKPGNASNPEVKFSEEELKKRLTPMQYHVTQEKGTERAFSGELTYNKESGIYSCVVCGTPLFKSDHKYDSGSGWPSFYDVMNSDAVDKHTDHSHGMKRVEVTCKKCGGHLGHVFDDGPMPSNERYCINSASLKFDKSKPKSDL